MAWLNKKKETWLKDNLDLWLGVVLSEPLLDKIYRKMVEDGVYKRYDNKSWTRVLVIQGIVDGMQEYRDKHRPKAAKSKNKKDYGEYYDKLDETGEKLGALKSKYNKKRMEGLQKISKHFVHSSDKEVVFATSNSSGYSTPLEVLSRNLGAQIDKELKSGEVRKIDIPEHEPQKAKKGAYAMTVIRRGMKYRRNNSFIRTMCGMYMSKPEKMPKERVKQLNDAINRISMKQNQHIQDTYKNKELDNE